MPGGCSSIFLLRIGKDSHIETEPCLLPAVCWKPADLRVSRGHQRKCLLRVFIGRIVDRDGRHSSKTDYFEEPPWQFHARPDKCPIPCDRVERPRSSFNKWDCYGHRDDSPRSDAAIDVGTWLDVSRHGFKQLHTDRSIERRQQLSAANRDRECSE